MVQVTCTFGCSCSTHVLNAHKSERTSLLAAHRVPVTQHPKCRLRLMVMAKQTAGAAGLGFRFKVSSVAVQYEEVV